MPYKKQLFTKKYDNLQDMIDVDDSRGRSVPINMNFIEEGYLTKDTGFKYFSDEDDAIRHSLFHFKKTNGESYIISGKGTKMQSFNHMKPITAVASTDVITHTAHGFVDTDEVTFWTDDTLPAGLEIDTVYFVRDAVANTFKVSLTSGGTAVDITSTGSGNNFVRGVNKGWEDLSPTFTEGAEFGFYVYSDTLYGSNSYEDYFSWTGQVFTDYASAPKGDTLEVFEDQMFVTGVRDEPGSYYYSDIGDATTFPGTKVVKPLGTDKAMGMKNYHGTLLMFKEKSIWKLTFQYDQIVSLFLPKITLQSNTYGACSKDAIAWVENDIWFFTGTEVRAIGFVDNQAGVFGVNDSVISDQIKETLKNIDRANFSKVKTFYLDRKYYLSVPISKETNNVLFVNHLLYKRRWTKYTGRLKSVVNSFVEVDGELITSTGVAPFRTVKWDDSLNDEETAIASEVFFRRIEDALFNRFLTYRYIDLKLKDIISTMRLVIKSEASDTTTSIVKDSYIGFATEDMENALGEVPSGQILVADSFGEDVQNSPFVKKRGSFLSKSQALIIGLANDKLNETFTLSEFILLGYEERRKTFSGRKIISMK